MSGRSRLHWLWNAAGVLVAIGLAIAALLAVLLFAAASEPEPSEGQRFNSCGEYFLEGTTLGDLPMMLSGGRFGASTELILDHDDDALVTVTGGQPLLERQLTVRPDILANNQCEADAVAVELTVTSTIRGDELAVGDRVEVILSPLARQNLELVLMGEAKVVVSMYRTPIDGGEGGWGLRFEEFGVLVVEGNNLAAIETLRPRYASVADLRLVVDEGSVLVGAAVPFSLDQPALDAVVEGEIEVPGALVAGELTPIVVSGLGGGTAFLVTCRQDAPDDAALDATCDLSAIQHELSYLGPTTLPYRPRASIQLSDGEFSCLEGPGCAVAVALTLNIGVRATGVLEFAK